MKQCVAHILRFNLMPYYQALRGLICHLSPGFHTPCTIGGYFLNKQTVRMAKQIKQRTNMVHINMEGAYEY